MAQHEQTNQNIFNDYKFIVPTLIAGIALALSIINYKNDNSEFIQTSDARVNIKTDNYITVSNKLEKDINILSAPINVEFDLYNNSKIPTSIKQIVSYTEKYEFDEAIYDEVHNNGLRFSEISDFYNSMSSESIKYDSIYVNNRKIELPINIPANNSVNIKLFMNLLGYYRLSTLSESDKKNEKFSISRKFYDDIIFDYDLSGNKKFESDSLSKLRYEPIFNVTLTTTKDKKVSTSSFNHRESKIDSIYISTPKIPIKYVDELMNKSR